MEVFTRIIASTFPRIAISTQDLSSLVARQPEAGESLAGESAEPIDQFLEKHARPELSNPYIAPRNETEKKIADIWQQILGIERVGIHDNFFELGGDSLIGVQVISQINKQLNTPVVSLYQSPTIGSFTDNLSREADDESPVEQKSRGKRRREKRLKRQRDR